jgi:hypothetical protein
MVLLAACGDGDADTATQSPATTQAATTTTEAVQALQPGPVTSFEDIAGTYELQGRKYFAGYLHFFEDGTWQASSNRDLVEDRPSEILETRFEGTKVFIKAIKGACVNESPDAIYEIHLLENGNLQFVLIEDMCAFRSGNWDGAEYAPVP